MQHKTQSTCGLDKSGKECLGISGARVSPHHGTPRRGQAPDPACQSIPSAHPGCSSHTEQRWLVAPAPRPPPAGLQSPHTPGWSGPGTRKKGCSGPGRCLPCFCWVTMTLSPASVLHVCHLPDTRLEKLVPKASDDFTATMVTLVPVFSARGSAESQYRHTLPVRPSMRVSF